MINTDDAALVIQKIKEEIDALLVNKGFIVLGCVGGRSITALLPGLAKAEIPWDKVHIFMIDERPDQSNFDVVSEHLIEPLFKQGKLPSSNAHPFLPKKAPDLGLSEYVDEFFKYQDRFDIALLSVGEDGHVASLFPGHKDGSDSFFIETGSPKPPSVRMTASRSLLRRSGLGVFLFVGRDKEEAYLEFLKPDSDIPAKIAYDMKSIILRVI